MTLTIAEALRQGTARLHGAGIETPALDARLLLGAATGLCAAAMLSEGRRMLSDREVVDFHACLDRRLGGEPVARILGRREFWSLDLLLSEHTLVPRPETETVVEATLAALRAGRPAPRVLDLGTGSGAILLAILAELPTATGVGVDLAVEALFTARGNARRLGLDGRAAFLCGDFADALAGRFDAVVSNPPYIPSADIPGLACEVRAFDPAMALDGGADGLDAYRRIAAVLPALLLPGGVAVLELGHGQEADAAAIMTAAGVPPTRPARRDLAGTPRALVVARPSSKPG